MEYAAELDSKMKEKAPRFLKYQRFWSVSYDLENGNKRLE